VFFKDWGKLDGFVEGENGEGVGAFRKRAE
jgi:hypothetical protein